MSLFEDQTYENLLANAMARVSSTFDKREGSMVYNGVAPSMAELAQLYIGLDFVFTATYIATAPRDYLIERAKDRGLSPKAASAAVFRAEFNIEVPVGSRFSCEELNFIVTERMTGEDTETGLSHKVTCETAGSAANDCAGDLIPIEYIAGLTTAKLVGRDIRKNPTLIWFVLALIGTYEEGLSIGSFLSQWLCNYVISYAYHFAAERLYKTRRGKRQNLVTHILVFMDDIIIFAASKHNAKAVGKSLEEYMFTQLGLHIKPNHNIKQTAKEPPDMMGYVVSKECTTIRARTFVRARRAILRAWRRMVAGLPIYLQNARRIVSYRGYFKHTNSRNIAKALHLKEVHRAARKVISKFAKGANENGNKSVLHRTPEQYQVYEPALG